MTKNLYWTDDEAVPRAEYDAIAARLAEAERRIEAAIVWDDGQDKVLLAILNGTRRPADRENDAHG